MKTTKYKITILPTDITRGIPGDPCRCMLARPIRRTLKEKQVSIYPQPCPTLTGNCRLGRGGIDIRLPKRANKAALRFDEINGRAARAKLIKPFSFTLCVPTNLG